MEQSNTVLEFECVERGRSIVRTVRPAEITEENLHRWYLNLKDFKTLFNDHVEGSFENFLGQFLEKVPNGFVPTGYFWEVDGVGLIRLSDVSDVEAKAHIAFWDGRLNGRETLIRGMAEHLFSTSELHRLVAEVPMYALPLLGFVERVGFRKEGTLREAVRYLGKWYDVKLYSMLRWEVLNNNGNEDKDSPAEIASNATE